MKVVASSQDAVQTAQEATERSISDKDFFEQSFGKK